MKNFPISLLLLLTAGLVLPVSTRAQSSGEFLEAVRQGGGWVEIPISEGVGTLSTDVLPTLGLTVSGCLNVWWGHSGRWRFEALDPVNGGRLRINASPGEGVPFSYRTGLRSSLELRVRWSEPEDTTLVLWVGLEHIASRRRDACLPVYQPDSPLGSSTASTRRLIRAVGAFAWPHLFPTAGTVPSAPGGIDRGRSRG